MNIVVYKKYKYGRTRRRKKEIKEERILMANQLIRIKEYFFNTATYEGEGKNIDKDYLQQTIKFLEEI